MRDVSNARANNKERTISELQSFDFYLHSALRILIAGSRVGIGLEIDNQLLQGRVI